MAAWTAAAMADGCAAEEGGAEAGGGVDIAPALVVLRHAASCARTARKGRPSRSGTARPALEMPLTMLHVTIQTGGEPLGQAGEGGEGDDEQTTLAIQ